MGKVCAIERCRNRFKVCAPSPKRISLYRFPEESNVSTEWRVFCRQYGSTLTGDLKHRRICSRHFTIECFKDPADTSKGLKKYAIPTLSGGELSQDVEYLEVDREKVEESMQHEKPDIDTGFRAMYEAEVKKVEELKSQLASERKIKRYLLHLCKKRKEALKFKTQQIINLKNDMRQRTKLKNETKLILDTVKSNPILLESVKNFSRKKNGRRYIFAKNFTTRQRLVSTSGYKKLRTANVLCLPHPKTINRWHQDVNISPGFNEQILQRMKIAGETMQDKEKVVSILIDGMAIKPMLDYHARSDRFHGLPTVETAGGQLREDNDPHILATESVTVMVRSLSTNYKQVIGYFLANATLGSDRQKDIVCEAVQKLNAIGFHPVVLTMDQHPTNVKMADSLGVTVENPVFVVDETTIVAMYDNPHLSKSVRNNLFAKNLLIDDQIISFNYIRDLYNLDIQNVPRLAPRLTKKAVFLPGFSKMNVSLATRTLSRTVAKALEAYIEMGSMSKEAFPTIEFLDVMDKLFDTFNSRFEQDITKPLRSAIRDDSEHWEFLDEAKNIFETAMFIPKTSVDPSTARKEAQDQLTANQRQPPSMKGFVQNINAIRKLWNILKTKFNFTHLCTNYICQDPLENEFAKVRRSCGCNDTPNALQFGAAIKYNGVERTLDHQENTNCKPDETVSLIDSDIQDEKSADPLAVVDNNSLIDLPCEMLDFENIDVPDKPETNALVYVIGFVISKLPHEDCRNKFRLPSSDKHMDDESFIFTKLKHFLNAAKFNFPNEVALELGITLLIAFKQKFYTYFQQHRCGVKKRLQKYINHQDYQEIACLKCFNRFSDCLLNTFINAEVKKMQEKYGRKCRRNGKVRRMNIEEHNGRKKNLKRKSEVAANENTKIVKRRKAYSDTVVNKAT